MKKIKLLLLPLCLFLLVGCLKDDSMDDIEIRTSAYPIQYITERLYGEHSTVSSIYPNGSIPGEKVNDKLLKDYSKTDLFIFNGEGENEKDYREKMSDYNKKLKTINVSSNLPYKYGVEELWLDPMNLLTMANNIKRGFEEYIDSAYLLNDIEKQYTSLKQDLIQLDADYRDMAETANRNTIVVSDNAFRYLEKYGLTVISLEEDETLLEKNIHTVKEMIANGDISYIYVIQGEEVNKTIQDIQAETNIELLELHSLFTRTDDEYNQDIDYLALMKNNLEQLKKQLYN